MPASPRTATAAKRLQAAVAVQNAAPTHDVWWHYTSRVSAADMLRPPYTSLTLQQLRQELSRRGLAIPASARKIHLLQALDEHDACSDTPAAPSSTQTGRAHSASSAVALTQAARESRNQAHGTVITDVAEALTDVQKALKEFTAHHTSDSEAALSAVFRSGAYISGGYLALSGRELDIVAHHIVRCCQ